MCACFFFSIAMRNMCNAKTPRFFLFPSPCHIITTCDNLMSTYPDILHISTHNLQKNASHHACVYRWSGHPTICSLHHSLSAQAGWWSLSSSCTACHTNDCSVWLSLCGGTLKVSGICCFQLYCVTSRCLCLRGHAVSTWVSMKVLGEEWLAQEVWTFEVVLAGMAEPLSDNTVKVIHTPTLQTLLLSKAFRLIGSTRKDSSLICDLSSVYRWEVTYPFIVIIICHLPLHIENSLCHLYPFLREFSRGFFYCQILQPKPGGS